MKLKKKVSLIIVMLEIIIQILNVMMFKSMAYDEKEYYINTAQDLWDFAKEVSEGNDFEGVTVYLTADIELECNENNKWIPIGNSIEETSSTVSSGKFKGTLEGNNHYIKGLYVETNSNAGLFGYVNGTIKNLTIKDSYISGTDLNVGSIASSTGSETNIINCINMSEVVYKGGEDKYNIGGIVGENQR